MKILMYGWEFPPRISGGLGIACYAMQDLQALTWEQATNKIITIYKQIKGS